jgi:DNA-binding transcriptional ArsR family regulator
MDKDYGAEIERINAELAQIKKLLVRNALPESEPPLPEAGNDVLSPEGRGQLIGLRNLLIAYADEQHKTGAVAYAGTFESDGRQSLWAMAVQTDYLLTLNDHEMAEKVLASIGNSQRLSILLELLKRPMTVSQLVETLGAKSTGLVYHHLKPLVLADILYEEKGVYAIKPHRMQGIIMLLAAVWDLTAPRYSTGSWGE